MIPIGINYAATTLVGQQIGAQNLKMSRKYTKLAIITSLIVGLFLGLTIIIFGYTVTGFYTNVEEVRRIVDINYQYLAISFFIECIKGCL
jgi:Na+-driven multidrug efflux pump